MTDDTATEGYRGTEGGTPDDVRAPGVRKSRTGDRETQGAQARTRTGHHPAGELGQPGLTDTLPEPLRPPENTGEAKDPSKSSDKQDWEKPKRVQ